MLIKCSARRWDHQQNGSASLWTEISFGSQVDSARACRSCRLWFGTPIGLSSHALRLLKREPTVISKSLRVPVVSMPGKRIRRPAVMKRQVMRDDLAMNTLANGSANVVETRQSTTIRGISGRSTRSSLDLRLPLPRRRAVVRKDLVSSANAHLPHHGKRRSNAKTALVDLANATVEAAKVNWPVAERRGVTLVCSTPSSGAVAADLTQVPAAIDALIAILVNSSPSGAVVTCSARMIEDEAVVSVVTTQCAASLLDVGRAMVRVRGENTLAPQVPGLDLDLWRASRHARLQGAHLAFVPQRNGAIAFELWLGPTSQD